MYNKYYIKAIKYSASYEDISSYINQHSINRKTNLFHPKDGSAAVLANMLEEKNHIPIEEYEKLY